METTAVTEKKKLTPEQRDIKIFEVAKSAAYAWHSKHSISTSRLNDMQADISNSGNRDLPVLWKYFLKAVNDHNSDLRATQTRLNNMKYSRQWRLSIPMQCMNTEFNKIAKYVDEYPELDAYEIYSKHYRLY